MDPAQVDLVGKEALEIKEGITAKAEVGLEATVVNEGAVEAAVVLEEINLADSEEDVIKILIVYKIDVLLVTHLLSFNTNILIRIIR